MEALEILAIQAPNILMDKPVRPEPTPAATHEMKPYAANLAGCPLGGPQLVLGEFCAVEIQAS